MTFADKSDFTRPTNVGMAEFHCFYAARPRPVHGGFFQLGLGVYWCWLIRAIRTCCLVTGRPLAVELETVQSGQFCDFFLNY